MVGSQIGGERVGARDDYAGGKAGEELSGHQHAPVEGGRA